MRDHAHSGRAAAPPNASDRPPPMRVGDHLALDFLNTIAAPRGATIEWIGNGRAFMAWLVDAGALDRANAVRAAAGWPPAHLDKVAAEAIGLREWFRGVVERTKAGGPHALTRKDVKRLNGVLARDAMFQRIESSVEDGRLHVVTGRLWRDPNELLGPIATAMADLLCEGDFDLVHKCKNPPCTIWFYDRTKGHRRRWCSQAVCGNRAKVAAHRARKR